MIESLIEIGIKGALIYLGVINIVAFVLYGIDKWKAAHDKWRIKEATLIGSAVIGGSIGALAGMKVFRHKTKHKKFTIGVPVILAIQVAAVLYALFKF